MKIKELKTRIGIESVVEHFGGEIEGESWDWWVPTVCPFHYDTQASASTHRGEGRFVCHGCDVRGDIIDLAIAGGVAITVSEAIDWLKENLL